MIKQIVILAGIVCSTCLTILSAEARSTGWVDGDEWYQISRTLNKNGEMPVSVVCKDTKNIGLSFKSGVAKVEIQKNTKGIEWHWAFGASVPVVANKLKNTGFKMVSYSEYQRASGLKIRCAIWHKG
jgi:hypothetical protein